MAGAGGIEPRNGGIKTAPAHGKRWRHFALECARGSKCLSEEFLN